MKGLILRTLIGWMAIEGLRRFSDIDPSAVDRLCVWLRGRPARNGKARVSPSTVSNYLLAIKDLYRIANNLRSCHTAVSTQGYVFEGHIPARYIHQSLANPPADAMGLTVPAMPVGSPGMEVGDKFMPYQILLMKKDGSTEVFASVGSMAQQYQPLQQPEAQP